MEWSEIKKSGSQHYKTGTTEPIDLYKSGGILQGYCIASIIKYAYRNREGIPSSQDMEKIKHLADMILSWKDEEHDRRNEEFDAMMAEQVTGEAPNRSESKCPWLSQRGAIYKCTRNPNMMKPCGATPGGMACLDDGLGNQCRYWEAK